MARGVHPFMNAVTDTFTHSSDVVVLVSVWVAASRTQDDLKNLPPGRSAFLATPAH